MPFVYYIPNGTPGITLDDLRAAGLGYAFESQPSACGCNCGPDKASGVTVCVDMDAVGYYEKRQTWRQIPGLSAWVGWETDKLPGPDDLARKQQIPGELVPLGDGNKWLVPSAIEWRETGDDKIPLFPLCALPRVFHLEDAGVWKPGNTKARYKPLEELGWQFLEAIHGKDEYNGVKLTDSWACQASVCALSFNYRISEVEASALGIIESDVLQAVARAVTDWDCVSEWAKKKQQRERSNTECGQQGQTQDSAQQ